jgi:hypothetical protein
MKSFTYWKMITLLTGKHKRRGSLGDLGVDESIMLILVLEE